MRFVACAAVTGNGRSVVLLGQVPTREIDRLQIGIERVRSAAEIYRSLPKYASPTDFAAAIRTLLGDHTNDPN